MYIKVIACRAQALTVKMSQLFDRPNGEVSEVSFYTPLSKIEF